LDEGIGEPTVVELPSRTLAGLSFFGNPFTSHAGWTEENEIGRLWQRFRAYVETQPEWLSSAVDGLGYEVHVVGPEMAASGEFECFVGAELAVPAALPIEVSAKAVPGGRFARFTVPGNLLATDMQMHIAIWLEEHDYDSAIPFDVVVYDERFHGMDRLDESVVEILVPLIER